MKHGYVLILTTFFSLQCVTSKSRLLNDTWTQLKANACKKGEQAKRVSSLLWSIKYIPEDLLLSASVWSKRLIVSCDLNRQLDSTNFNYLRISNDSLDILMPMVFNKLHDSQDSLEQTMFVDIQNDYLKEAKKIDSIKVIFDSISKNDKAPYHFASYTK